MSATSACSRGPGSTTSTGFCNRGPDTPHPTGCVTGWEARIRAPSSPRSPSRETIRCAWRPSTVSSRFTAARPATSRSRPWPRGEWWWAAASRPGSARGWPTVVSSRPFSPRDASRRSSRPCPSRSPSILGRRSGAPRAWRGSWPGHERRGRYSTKAVREAGRADMTDPLGGVPSQTWTLPTDLEVAVKAEIQAWQEAGKVRRLWERDASLWTGTDEASWLGWLELPAEEIAQLDHLKRAQEDARTGGFDHVLLLGMGGSSLCPEVLRMTFGRVAGFPELHVLDSTDPAQIRSVERRLDPAKTLFIVSSKSGATLEPNIFKDYFFDRVRRAVGEEGAGSRFIAITDPRSKLQQVAEAAHFRHVYFGVPSVGGRYSALSDFGMVPGAIMGLDVGHFLSRAAEMATACSASAPGSSSSSPSPRARKGRGSFPWTASPPATPPSTAPIGSSSTCVSSPAPTSTRTSTWPPSSGPGIRSCASASAIGMIWGRNSSDGSSPRRWQDRSSASMPSTSPTSRRARSPRGS